MAVAAHEFDVDVWIVRGISNVAGDRDVGRVGTAGSDRSSMRTYPGDRRMKLRVGISPCPNDTFAFHGILERRVDLRGLDIEIEFADVQALNDGLVGGRYDLSKASFHQALLLSDQFGVLRAGSALGFGVGPLLVSADPGVRPRAHARVLCPGADHDRHPALPVPAPPPAA